MTTCGNPSCGRETENPRFCSMSCAAIVNNSLHPKRSKKEKPAKVRKARGTEKVSRKRGPYMLARYHRRRSEALERLGGRCVQCGSTESLEFDHIEPRDKGFSLGRAFATWAEARLIDEVAKCQILCGLCHKEKSRLDLREAALKREARKREIRQSKVHTPVA